MWSLVDRAPCKNETAATVQLVVVAEKEPTRSDKVLIVVSAVPVRGREAPYDEWLDRSKDRVVETGEM